METKQEHATPPVALCYVRQSYTRDDDDTNSPERQRDNIERILKRNGWIAEWYEDVGGHKSGQYEDNRPAWLQLKERLEDEDVVALIANDLSRLHRNIANISSLVDTLQTTNISLILAASDITIDTSTLMGQMFAQFSGLMDAYYAKDISAKAKDSIAYRKRQGKVVGLPPFGTTRDEEGYLIPTHEGAWYLPDGTFAKGTLEEIPAENALWRNYFDCAKYILTLFAENAQGMEKIAYQLNEEGWAFRDRWGNPRTIERDDIRRVVSNWPTYGGLVMDKRNKDRPGYEELDAETIEFVEERAVMPIDLIRKVALVRQQRTIRPKEGKTRKAYSYPMSVITRCAHCERLADEQGDDKLRTSFTGRRDDSGVRRYKHRDGVKCGCKNRSVPCDILDADVIRLIRLMTIDSDMVKYMTEFAIQADKAQGMVEEVDVETQKQEAIALARRRIKAAVVLFDEGRIDYQGYRERIDKYEREISYWQSRTTEAEKIAFELAKCVEAVTEIDRLWDTTEPETKQRLARNLFEYVIYNLDTRRIEGYKLHAWAEKFVTIRTALYDDLFAVLGETKTPHQEEGKGVPPRGFENTTRFTVDEAVRELLYRYYRDNGATLTNTVKTR